MKFCYAITFCLYIFLTSFAQVDSDNFLDLTKLKPAKNERAVYSGDVNLSGGNDTRSPRLEIQVMLLSLDKRIYKMGDEMVFDLALTNAGQNTIVIPWSPYGDQIRPTDSYPPGYVNASIGLVIKDKVLGEQIVYGPGLYGSGLVPSSLKKLRPGQTVRIRAAGRWALTSDDLAHEILARLPQNYEAQARFRLMDRSVNPPEPVISSNSVTVELRRRSQ